MEDLRKEQIEALETLQPYIKKLQAGIKEIIPELEGEKREDTEDFLKQILNGINWTIEVINRTQDVFQEKGKAIDKEEINDNISKLSKALKNKEDKEVAAIFNSGILPCLYTLEKSLEVII